MPKNRINRPIILGIVGDSASGKTTLAAGIRRILGEDRVVTICTDDYHKYSRSQRKEIGISALDPRGNYIDIIEQDLQLLRNGKSILKPIYNHSNGELDPPEYIEPKPYIVVEGLLGYSTRAMRDCYDVKIYLDPKEDLRIEWKIMRDTSKRGYSREQVLQALKKREHDSPAYIHPQRTYADIVVSFRHPEDNPAAPAQNLDVQHILRPTLPHPDLRPILNMSEQNGIVLVLSRDADGKPVDILEIRGSIHEHQADRIEELLWSLIPEAAHLQKNWGTLADLHSMNTISHPLMLTQLLITHHMVKAALGVHAL